MRKIIRGIIRDEQGAIVDIDPLFEDPDDVGLNLEMLRLEEAKKLDEDLTSFFYDKGESQGKTANEGEGGDGIVPWGRGLSGGSLAWDLEYLVQNINGMNGSYVEMLWEGYEAGLPDHLVVEGNEGDGAAWSVVRILDYTCPKCDGTLTTTDESEGVCRECRTPLPKKIRIIKVMCGTQGCRNFETVINTITGPMNAEDLDAFYENFGSGVEEDADYCPRCGNLGELLDPEVSDAPVQNRTDEDHDREGDGAGKRTRGPGRGDEGPENGEGQGVHVA